MSILKLNSANPGVKRPLKVQDLADLWYGLNTALAQGTETSPRILCGFNANGDDSFTSGVIAYNGRLYLYDDSDPIFFEDSIYGVEIPTDDNRVMGDGTTQLFSYACIVTKDSTLPGAVFIGEASPSNIGAWRGPLSIPELSITRTMIENLAISTIKLADSAVTTPKLAYMLRPCVLSSLPYDYTASSTALTVSLLDLITTPASTASRLWEMKTAKVAYNRTLSPLVVTIRAYNLGSSFSDWPAVLPLMLSYSSETVTTVDVRIEYPLPFANQAGLRYSKTYTVKSGDTIQFMLTKVPSKLGYVPTSVIFNEP
nr:MAG TPA: hypothetical protein [Caudoviricetes sp.]